MWREGEEGRASWRRSFCATGSQQSTPCQPTGITGPLPGCFRTCACCPWPPVRTQGCCQCKAVLTPPRPPAAPQEEWGHCCALRTEALQAGGTAGQTQPGREPQHGQGTSSAIACCWIDHERVDEHGPGSALPLGRPGHRVVYFARQHHKLMHSSTPRVGAGTRRPAALELNAGAKGRWCLKWQGPTSVFATSPTSIGLARPAHAVCVVGGGRRCTA